MCKGAGGCVLQDTAQLKITFNTKPETLDPQPSNPKIEKAQPLKKCSANAWAYLSLSSIPKFSSKTQYPELSTNP